VTLKIRVSRISYMSVDNAVNRMPIAVRPVAIEEESGLDMCMLTGPRRSRGPCHGSATARAARRG
jgi:hypothetical protein